MNLDQLTNRLSKLNRKRWVFKKDKRKLILRKRPILSDVYTPLTAIAFEFTDHYIDPIVEYRAAIVIGLMHRYRHIIIGATYTNRWLKIEEPYYSYRKELESIWNR